KIGDDLRQRLRELEPHLRREKEELAVTPAAAEALESLGDASAEFVRSVRWKANLERLEAARAADDAPLPALQVTLRDYQQAGFRWMNRLATWGLGACLADDMGLGKTLQALAIIAARASNGPQLVIAPTSVVYNWVREAQKFTPDLDFRLYIGGDRAGLLDDVGPQTVVVTSYGLVVRDIETLRELSFTTVVLDEAQAIKNAQSQRSIAVRQLRADWRLALSGTPVENHLGELWSLFDALAPGLLGSWSSFRDRFVAPIERDGNRERAEALSRLLRPFILRRTKREVAKSCPPAPRSISTSCSPTPSAKHTIKPAPRPSRSCPAHRPTVEDVSRPSLR
ncbi:MAG: SNF2-related protein, partial [Myxococcota bacterium]